MSVHVSPPRLIASALALVAVNVSTTRAADDSSGARFFRDHWYQPVVPNGESNPQRVRVHAAEVVVGKYGSRPDATQNGLILLQAKEDLSQLERAELYLEMWGGHPGSAGKRVTVNGRSTYAIPEIGTHDGYCTHQYPRIPLKLSDLVNGHDAFQLGVDQGRSFWGTFIVEQAAVRAVLKASHPDLRAAKLDGFDATVEATAAGEGIRLALKADPAALARVAAVEFHGHYLGYDENGDGRASDWHGYTKAREPMAIVGRATAAPFAVTWNTSMLPAQDGMAVKAFVRFKDAGQIAFVTAPRRGLATPARRRERVVLQTIPNFPPGFWSRANEKKEGTIPLDVDPAKVTAAELHIVVWDGGEGNVKEPFRLNGHPVKITSGHHRHDVIYTVARIDPRWLRAGPNKVELVSDTEHHGIEVLSPGPALLVRSRP